MIAIEIDEHEHSGYDELNDEIRYNGLMMVTGTNWVIIRFNPDRTKKCKLSLNERLPKLLEMVAKEVESAKACNFNELFFRNEYLYYSSK